MMSRQTTVLCVHVLIIVVPHEGRGRLPPYPRWHEGEADDGGCRAAAVPADPVRLQAGRGLQLSFIPPRRHWRRGPGRRGRRLHLHGGRGGFRLAHDQKYP